MVMFVKALDFENLFHRSAIWKVNSLNFLGLHPKLTAALIDTSELGELKEFKHTATARRIVLRRKTLRKERIGRIHGHEVLIDGTW